MRIIFTGETEKTNKTAEFFVKIVRKNVEILWKNLERKIEDLKNFKQKIVQFVKKEI